MTAHLLAKLTAQGVSISGEGFGGQGGLTEGDIAASMSGMPIETYQYMRLKFCADHTQLASVTDRIVYRLLSESMLGAFDLKVSVIKQIALLIVEQATKGPICGNCSGTGVIVRIDSAADCGECAGSGRGHMRKDVAAKFLGIRRQTYVKNYEELVSRYVADLQGLESSGMAYIRRKLGGENS